MSAFSDYINFARRSAEGLPNGFDPTILLFRGSSPDDTDVFYESSSFLIETNVYLTPEEVAERFSVQLSESGEVPGPIIVEAMGVDLEAGERDVDFIVEVPVVNQLFDAVSHAEIAIQMAEQMEELWDWIRSAQADIVLPDPSLKLFSSGKGCSAGDPPHGHNGNWGIDAVRAVEAANYAQQQNRPSWGADVIIGHIDTGYGGHREMDQACTPDRGYDFIKKQGGGYDPLSGQKSQGHGDSTGSVLVSRASYDVDGIARAATTIPYRAISFVAIFTKMGRVAKAIKRATDDGVNVISMSLGGLSVFSGLDKALRYAESRGVISIAAAGNCVGFLVAPASKSRCIAVSGIDPDLRPWAHASSDRAKKRIDIAGPAQWVRSATFRAGTGGTFPNGRFSDASEGTSYATAMTAGAAAQWLAFHGLANVRAVAQNSGLSILDYFRTILRATSHVPPDWDTAFGRGVLDIEALLREGLPAANEMMELPKVAFRAAEDDRLDEEPTQLQKLNMALGRLSGIK